MQALCTCTSSPCASWGPLPSVSSHSLLLSGLAGPAMAGGCPRSTEPRMAWGQGGSRTLRTAVRCCSCAPAFLQKSYSSCLQRAEWNCPETVSFSLHTDCVRAETVKMLSEAMACTYNWMQVRNSMWEAFQNAHKIFRNLRTEWFFSNFFIGHQ